MSDVAQGPGWWQASDGKWYPPESHPSAAPLPPPTLPPPQPSAPTVAPERPPSKPWWKKWWVIALGAVVVLGIVGSIVGSNDSESEERVADTSSPSADTTAQSDDSQGTQDTVPQVSDTSPPETVPPVTEETEPPTTEASMGLSPEAPAPVGQPLVVTIDGFGDGDQSRWGLRVDGPGVNLTDAIEAENQFNEPPPAGTIFYGVPITVSLLEANKEPLSTWLNIELEFYGPISRSIIGVDFDNSCGVVPGAFDDFKEVFVGGSVSGIVCFAVGQDDVDAGVLLTSDSFAGERIFISTVGAGPVLDMPAAVGSSGSGSGDPGTRDNPIPVGQPFTFTVEGFGDGDGATWTLVVDGPGADYTPAVLAENQFNDPPSPGSLFYAVPVTITLDAAGKEPLSTFANIEFEFYGPSTLAIIGLDLNASCGVTPGEFDPFKEVFVGGSVAGMICFNVQQADADAGLLLTLDSSDGGRLFFATR